MSQPRNNFNIAHTQVQVSIHSSEELDTMDHPYITYSHIGAPVMLETETVTPSLPPNEAISQRAVTLTKLRNRMRRRRARKQRERDQLNAQVEALTNTLHQLLNKSEYTDSQTSPDAFTNSLCLPHELRKEQLIRSYVQLIAMSDKIRQENEETAETLSKVWKKYIYLVDNEVHKCYGISTPLHLAPPIVTLNAKHVLSCQSTDKKKIYPYKDIIKDSGQWVSFVRNPPAHEDENDKNVLLFRESSDDVYFRQLNDTVCAKLIAEGYEEGEALTNTIEQETKIGNRPIVKEMDYFGWKLTYYQISTAEAYPHLTQVTNLDGSNSSDSIEDMVRFDYVKRYTLESNQDFKSIFNQIRERCWQILTAPIPVIGIRVFQNAFVGCVLQNINDHACITIRSFVNRKTNYIHRFVSLMHHYEYQAFVSIVNPVHCLNRIEGCEQIKYEDNGVHKCKEENIFWETHGLCRFHWYIVGDREYEIRYGGTLLLGEYKVNEKIVETGELLVGWEQMVFRNITE